MRSRIIPKESPAVRATGPRHSCTSYPSSLTQISPSGAAVPRSDQVQIFQYHVARDPIVM